MPRILITGASGRLGRYVIRHFVRQERSDVVAWSGATRTPLFGIAPEPVDLSDFESVERAFARVRPDIIIHAAAMSRLSDCVADPARAARVNAEASGHLARLAGTTGCRMVYLSTDLVFDGSGSWYSEDAPPAPVSVYGRSKLQGEQASRAASDSVLVRLANLFGPTLGGQPSMHDQLVTALRQRVPITLFDDEWRSPLAFPVAAAGVAAIAASPVVGLLHLGGPDRLSRLEMGLLAAEELGLDPAPIRAARRSDIPAAEPRPRDVSLDSTRWRTAFPDLWWPDYRTAIRDMAARP